MGIWQHIHTVTTTDVSPDLGEFAEILDDVNVKTIPLRYRWGCKSFQTASHIHEINHITHIQRGWAHWYAVHWHTSAALLHSFTHTIWIRFWGSGSLVMMWVYVMVEADRLPPSISDIYKVCEHIDIIDMLSIGIQQQPSYTVIHPSWLRFWGSGSLVESKWCQKVVVWSFCPSCQCAWPLNWREGPPLLRTHRQVASASALLPMQSASQLKRMMTSFRWHINPQHTAASTPTRP